MCDIVSLKFVPDDAANLPLNALQSKTSSMRSITTTTTTNERGGGAAASAGTEELDVSPVSLDTRLAVLAETQFVFDNLVRVYVEPTGHYANNEPLPSRGNTTTTSKATIEGSAVRDDDDNASTNISSGTVVAAFERFLRDKKQQILTVVGPAGIGKTYA